MKNIARLTVLVMLFMALVGFSGGDMVAASASATEATAGTTDEGNPWAGLDTSDEAKIVVYVLGTKPNDLNLVLDEVNARMKELINTTIELNFIGSLADFATRYPLLLTGGDDIDLVYAADWCFFNEQANKGAFYELTDEFLQTYMPESLKNQPEQSWKQVKLDGKTYAVTRNQASLNVYGGFLIRKDLREKYGLSEITSLEELEQYFYAVAENETDIFGFYAFPSLPLTSSFLIPFENWFQVYNNLLYWDADKGVAKAEDLFFIYDTEEYKNYALKMAEWAAKGVWPSNAMTGSTQTSDLFVEGKSASMPCRLEIDSAMESAQEKGLDVEYVNILPETTYIKYNEYSGDCMAIASFSKNKERAAICLDVMKNDKTINMMLEGGIEGKHYVLNSDGTRSDGPDADNYVWDCWAWGLRDKSNPDLEHSDIYETALARYTSQLMPDGMWVFDGFRADDSPLSAEIAVINSLITEYSTSFDLGAFGSETAAKYDEFIAKLKSAGLDKVVEMWKSQIAEYIGKQ